MITKRKTDFKQVKIGKQTWMAENLALNDGGEGIYHNNGHTYYTWEAAVRVASSVDGWHLPSQEEWETLFAAVGGIDTAGTMLKSTKGWNQNGNGTDAYGLSLLPSGCRYGNGYFDYAGDVAYFWSSAEYDSNFAYYVLLGYNDEGAYLYYGRKNNAFAVRLVKNY